MKKYKINIRGEISRLISNDQHIDFMQALRAGLLKEILEKELLVRIETLELSVEDVDGEENL